MNALSQSKDGTLVHIRVVPNAKKSCFDGFIGSRIKIRIQAPPVDGKASRKLVEFLAQETGFRKSAMRITAGETSRDKTVLITHDISSVSAALEEKLQGLPVF